MVINVLEVFAKDEDARREARAGWIARGEALELMYSNIDGLQGAELETKNFIYDAMIKKVFPLVLAAI